MEKVAQYDLKHNTNHFVRLVAAQECWIPALSPDLPDEKSKMVFRAMILVMPRYDCSLDNLIEMSAPSAEGDDLDTLQNRFRNIPVALRTFHFHVRISCILQILAGLDVLHQLKIYHRDLKAENILVKIQPDGSYNFLIADFGISSTRYAENHTRSSRNLRLNESTPIGPAPMTSIGLRASAFQPSISRHSSLQQPPLLRMLEKEIGKLGIKTHVPGMEASTATSSDTSSGINASDRIVANNGYVKTREQGEFEGDQSAPEAQGTVDERMDVYTFGILLFQIMTLKTDHWYNNFFNTFHEETLKKDPRARNPDDEKRMWRTLRPKLELASRAHPGLHSLVSLCLDAATSGESNPHDKLRRDGTYLTWRAILEPTDGTSQDNMHEYWTLEGILTFLSATSESIPDTILDRAISILKNCIKKNPGEFAKLCAQPEVAKHILSVVINRFNQEQHREYEHLTPADTPTDQDEMGSNPPLPQFTTLVRHPVESTEGSPKAALTGFAPLSSSRPNAGSIGNSSTLSSLSIPVIRANLPPIASTSSSSSSAPTTTFSTPTKLGMGAAQRTAETPSPTPITAPRMPTSPTSSIQDTPLVLDALYLDVLSILDSTLTHLEQNGQYEALRHQQHILRRHGQISDFIHLIFQKYDVLKHPEHVLAATNITLLLCVNNATMSSRFFGSPPTSYRNVSVALRVLSLKRKVYPTLLLLQVVGSNWDSYIDHCHAETDKKNAYLVQLDWIKKCVADVVNLKGGLWNNSTTTTNFSHFLRLYCLGGFHFGPKLTRYLMLTSENDPLQHMAQSLAEEDLKYLSMSADSSSSTSLSSSSSSTVTSPTQSTQISQTKDPSSNPRRLDQSSSNCGHSSPPPVPGHTSHLYEYVPITVEFVRKALLTAFRDLEDSDADAKLRDVSLNISALTLGNNIRSFLLNMFLQPEVSQNWIQSTRGLCLSPSATFASLASSSQHAPLRLHWAMEWNTSPLLDSNCIPCSTHSPHTIPGERVLLCLVCAEKFHHICTRCGTSNLRLVQVTTLYPCAGNSQVVAGMEPTLDEICSNFQSAEAAVLSLHPHPSLARNAYKITQQCLKDCPEISQKADRLDYAHERDTTVNDFPQNTLKLVPMALVPATTLPISSSILESSPWSSMSLDASSSQNSIQPGNLRLYVEVKINSVGLKGRVMLGLYDYSKEASPITLEQLEEEKLSDYNMPFIGYDAMTGNLWYTRRVLCIGKGGATSNRFKITSRPYGPPIPVNGRLGMGISSIDSKGLLKRLFFIAGDIVLPKIELDQLAGFPYFEAFPPGPADIRMTPVVGLDVGARIHLSSFDNSQLLWGRSRQLLSTVKETCPFKMTISLFPFLPSLLPSLEAMGLGYYIEGLLRHKEEHHSEPEPSTTKTSAGKGRGDGSTTISDSTVYFK